MPVQRHVGGVEVEDDLSGRRAVRLQEQVHEQRLDRRRLVAHAVIPAGLAHGRVLEAVQRALARQRGATGAACLQLAGEHGQHRVVPQVVMVDQVLVAERDAEDALADQGGDLMLDPLRIAGVAEAAGEARDEADRSPDRRRRAAARRHPR